MGDGSKQEGDSTYKCLEPCAADDAGRDAYAGFQGTRRSTKFAYFCAHMGSCSVSLLLSISFCSAAPRGSPRGSVLLNLIFFKI
jgi:hypothetical protein